MPQYGCEVLIAGAHRLRNRCAVLIQRLLNGLQIAHGLFAIDCNGAAQFQGVPKRLQHRRFGGAVAVQLKHGVAQKALVQAAFHHLECRHFFGHEQHRFFLRQQFGNQVGDGL